jgi:alkylhydroperoxidase/carboxymuconolactone decarboxylase family protein
MAGYYKEGQLGRFGELGATNKVLIDKFFDYYGSVFEDGALTAREKALIALAVAHTVQCPYCIESTSGSALKAGADAAQQVEAIHVAAAIRGGAALVHGVQTIEHLEAKGAWPAPVEDK